MCFVFLLWVESNNIYNMRFHKCWNYVEKNLEKVYKERRLKFLIHLLQPNECTYDRRLVNIFRPLVKLMNTDFLLFCK